MQTQINCPNCNSSYVAEIYQIIDVGQNPQLKHMFLNGQLNLAQCSVCGAATRVTTPLLYHDPEHELFMVHVPMEMGLQHSEQEKLIGQLVRQAMDSLPPEQRRGYMLQPQTVMSMQSFLEQVLATEGVTPEMIARQKEQTELLQVLLSADQNVEDQLIHDREDEIDGTFFAMLTSVLEAAERAGQESQVLKLINLRAKLYRKTEYGKRLERQQKALYLFSRDVKKAGDLTPSLLLKHVMANRDDDLVVQALVSSGQQAFNYQFFVLLTEKIDKREKAGVNADELMALREKLVVLQETYEKQTREMLAGAQKVLGEILEADDKEAVIRANLDHLDDAFMTLLSLSLTQAEEQGDSAGAAALFTVQQLVINEFEKQAPPEIQLINNLLRMEGEEEKRQLLEENAQLVKPELLEVIRAIEAEAGGSGNNELESRLNQLEAMIEARL